MIGSWDKLDYIAFKMAATKSSKDARQVGLSWHEKRCEVREKSTKGTYFRSSLQCLDNNEILLLLESILSILPRSKQGTQMNCTVRPLRAVQEHLMHGYGYIWKKPTIYILHSVNFPVQISKHSEINCLILITVCLSTKSRQRHFLV